MRFARLVSAYFRLASAKVYGFWLRAPAAQVWLVLRLVSRLCEWRRKIYVYEFHIYRKRDVQCHVARRWYIHNFFEEACITVTSHVRLMFFGYGPFAICVCAIESHVSSKFCFFDRFCVCSGHVGPRGNCMPVQSTRSGWAFSSSKGRGHTWLSA